MKTKRSFLLLLLGLFLVLTVGTMSVSAATSQTVLTNQQYFTDIYIPSQQGEEEKL